MPKNVCEPAHSYDNIDQEKINAILAELKKGGATVTGENPWDVDTHKSGVKLQGSWDSATAILTIIVTDKSWYVPCCEIWDTIDQLNKQIQDNP